MDRWFKNLVNSVKDYLPQIDESRLLSAYKLSERVYADRIAVDGSGDFVFRGRDVVDVLSYLKPDEDALIAAFLCDLPDSDFFSVGILNEDYGEGVLSLIEGLRIMKSIKVVKYESSDKIDLLRKLFLVMAKDIRVLVILLSIKVVQMNLLSKLPKDCAEHFASEVLEIFVPIASRLGVYRFKIMLEDKAFECLQPIEYKKISDQVDKIGKKKGEYITNVSKILEDFFIEHGFQGVKVSGRMKGFFSIYNKISKKGLDSIEGVYDVFAFRVVLSTEYVSNVEEDVSRLYEALGLLHSRWKPIASRFKDFVAVPKANGYRSLHTTVVGLSDGEIVYPVEIQIRSEGMHDEAEYGVASHWLYKDTRGRALSMLRSHVEWLKNLAILHTDVGSDDKVLDSVKLDLFGDRIYVLTPKGEVMELPFGSTTLDFAYFIHTEIGHRCVLAKVNGKPVSLDTELLNGDTVEIVTKKDPAPKLEWLSLVRTSQAKVKIKSWFASQDGKRHVRLGRDCLNAQLVRLGKPVLTPSYSILKNFGGQRLSLQEREKVLEEIGKGSQPVGAVIRKIYGMEDLLDGQKNKLLKNRDKKVGAIPRKMEDVIVVGGVSGMKIKLAECCMPSYGDDIVGYVSSMKNLVTVHKADCNVLMRLNPERKVVAGFKDLDPDGRRKILHRISVKIEAVPRVGLIGDIGSTIAANGVNIVSHNALDSDDGSNAKISLVMDVSNLDQLEKTLDSLERVNGVKFVKKVS